MHEEAQLIKLAGLGCQKFLLLLRRNLIFKQRVVDHLQVGNRGQEYDNVELSVIPGITAANSGAAVLGAPLNHDFCTISLSDLLTPWDKIEKRLVAAAEGDFVIALYNPSSHKRKDYLMRACDILLRAIEPERPCGYVENIGREGTSYTVCTLGELRSAQVNMFTTVFIGNEGTQIIDGKLVTRRGYQIE